MTASTDPRVQSIIETIDTCLAQAECLPGTAAHDAMFDSVPALKARIDDTLAGDAQAAAHALGYLTDMFERFKRRRPITRLPYSPQLDARYPFRDAALNPIHIVSVTREPGRSGARNDPQREAVLPFVDPEADEATLAAAYHDRLVCRTITDADLLDPRERVLAGQLGVFARRALRSGECLGVYGGQLLTPAMYFACADDSFILSAVSGGHFAWVDGENILAMANTRLAYDADGLPVGQAGEGYNMKAVRFHVVSDCGRRFSIGAFFATEDIEAGTELRWNYGHSAEVIAAAYRPMYLAG
jgi:hypothetical protein